MSNLGILEEKRKILGAHELENLRLSEEKPKSSECSESRGPILKNLTSLKLKKSRILETKNGESWNLPHPGRLTRRALLVTVQRSLG